VGNILKVNLTSCFLLMKECIPLMIKNSGGSIVNIASLAGKRCLPFSPGYCPTKAALIHLTKQVAMDYSRDGVRCNAICPAAVVTDMTKGMVGPLAENLGTDLKSGYAFFTRNIPAQRACDPMEIASVAAFLASDEASFITGEDILVDGGACVVGVMSIGLER
jgi:NAD(P)-dependent dehydrogenase (short-subunit alcohol dehydrogenase family)